MGIKTDIYTHIFEDSSEGVKFNDYNDAMEYLDGGVSGYLGTFFRSADGKRVEFWDMEQDLGSYRNECASERSHEAFERQVVRAV